MFNFMEIGNYIPEKLSEKILAPVEMMTNQINAAQNCCTGFSKYLNEFMVPLLLASNYITDTEKYRIMSSSPIDSFQSYLQLLDFNLNLSSRCLTGTMRAVNDYNNREMKNALEAWFNTVFQLKGEDIPAFMNRHSEIMKGIAKIYPKAIRDIEPEFGFHFERGINIKVSETDRFILYQVVPVDNRIPVNQGGKPILILPPYVLGANILAFLPKENKSYTHAYANMGIPTYIRILKDIASSPALQTMTAEDDALDTRFFCEKIMERHGKPVTLNGYCQGGFSAICDYLSGELDGVVDALLTCVSPMDGTRSKGLSGFLKSLPERFNDLIYGTKTLPNGNRVADGKLMGWVYKLKSIENESPVVAFIRDMMMLTPGSNNEIRISKTAAALNYWLDNERSDLPLAITQMSFDSFNIPITSDGTLPIKMFGRSLNFKRIQEKGIPWLICYGEKDDLVERDTALAPTDYIPVELSAFPKGHVAMATSWSDPRSACALHTRFGSNNYRGPVKYHLDLDEELSKAAQKAASKPKKKAVKEEKDNDRLDESGKMA